MSSKKRVWIRLVCGFCTVALLVGSQSFITFADKTDEIEESIKEKVTEEYLKVFPELKGKYSVHICESADGVQL